MLSGVFTHGWVGHAGVNMGHLLPELLGCPAHRVLIRGMFDDVAPMVAAALFAEQLFKPLVAYDKHWISMNHKSCGFGSHATLLQCFCTQ